TELQASNRDLTQALEQRTATAEVLGVIASAQTDIQPVFDTIAANALRLCAAFRSGVYRFDGDVIYVGPVYGGEQGSETVRRDYPMRPERGSGTARAILTRQVVYIRDTREDPEFRLHGAAAAAGIRSILAVPMLREGNPIGAVVVTAPEVAAFSDSQVELLKTFADQAVIAIENVRLFRELEARNTGLTESLARQMATGEVLRAISQAQADAQPVFEIIAASARRLCGAAYAQVQLYDGELIHLAALESGNPESDDAIRAAYPLRVGDGSAGGRAIATCAVTQIPDLLDDQAYAFTAVWQASRLRSLLAVPMLRDGEPVGVIGIGRMEPGMFPDSQIALLQ